MGTHGWKPLLCNAVSPAPSIWKMSGSAQCFWQVTCLWCASSGLPWIYIYIYIHASTVSNHLGNRDETCFRRLPSCLLSWAACVLLAQSAYWDKNHQLRARLYIVGGVHSYTCNYLDMSMLQIP